jgi:hypothetical protein
VKLLEPGIELYLAGLHPTAGVCRPSSTVSFLRFLARVASFAPCEVPCAIGLNSTAMSRPERTPPTSPPACARGPTDSGHHRRRAVPRHDRQDFQELTPPFTGPPSPPVSRVALFTSAFTVSKKGGISGRKKKNSRGFKDLVSQGHMLKIWFKKSPGVSV